MKNAKEDQNAVPKAVADEKTAPMRLPTDAFPNPFVSDENWEEEPTNVLPGNPVFAEFGDDEKTVIPTGD